MQFHFAFDTIATPEQVVAAFTDFTDRRLEIWKASLDPAKYELQELGDTWAIAREGSKSPSVWAVEHYDWSEPGTVRWAAQHSNFCKPGSGVELVITSRDNGGSHVEGDWHRTQSASSARSSFSWPGRCCQRSFPHNGRTRWTPTQASRATDTVAPNSSALAPPILFAPARHPMKCDARAAESALELRRAYAHRQSGVYKSLSATASSFAVSSCPRPLRNSREAAPRLRASPGNFVGPKINNATAKMISSSGAPTFIDRQDIRAARAQPLHRRRLQLGCKPPNRATTTRPDRSHLVSGKENPAPQRSQRPAKSRAGAGYRRRTVRSRIRPQGRARRSNVRAWWPALTRVGVPT